LTKWKKRRKTKTEVLSELVFRILSDFPNGLQYNDLVNKVNAETRHTFSRNGVSQKFRKQKNAGLLILEPLPKQSGSYSWKLAEGITWNQFDIGAWKPDDL
tara:strand:+ start:194 stop:496 length:303 start_codon:yes stop_codon:yes gene_type:complete